MKALKNGLGVGAVAAAIFVLPGGASGETVVPPGNSAATQYTEAIPAGGGRQDTNRENGSGPSAAAVLGAGRAKQLHAKGREGREAVEVIVATAPSPPPAPAPSSAPALDASGDDGGGGSQPARARGGDAGGQPAGEPAARAVEIPAGSSGLSEVLAQATGSATSGQLGLLLPLLIGAALAWALAYLWHGRRQPA